MKIQEATLEGDELERIGQLGENRFKDLCDRARLKCSKVEPDKTGKDFIVEFPLERASQDVSYDMRPAPKQILVQVKTILARNHRATLALSVAERLIQDLRPAIICIFRIDAYDTITDVHFVHLRDRPLGAVLRRLRLQSKNGKDALHKASVSFTIKTAIKVDLNIASFYAALVALIDTDMHAYAEKKSHELKTLGFDGNAVTLKFSVEDIPINDVVDGLLGLQELPVTNMRVFEKRFEIELPKPSLFKGATGGKVRFAPSPVDHGEITLDSGSDGELITIPCDVVTIPARIIGVEHMKFLFRSELGQFEIGNNNWKYSAAASLEANESNEVSRWLQFYKIMRLFSFPTLKIRYTSSNKAPEIIFNGFRQETQSDVDTVQQVIDLLRDVEAICLEAAVENPSFSLQKVWGQRQGIRVVKSMRDAKIKITARDDGPIESDLLSIDGAYLSAVEIGNSWLAIYMPLNVSATSVDNEVEWTGVKSGTPVFEAIIGDPQTGFDHFRKKMLRVSSVDCLFVQDPGYFLAEEKTFIETTFERH